MMFRKLTSACLIIFFLAACAPTLTPTPVLSTLPATEVPLATSITLIDGLDRTVSLPGSAQKVVSLAASNTEILYAIGAGDQVVGRDMFSDYPAEVKTVQDIGGSMGEYNLEAIVTLQPDLVLAGGINPPELIAALEELGLTVYYVSNPTTLEEMYTRLEIVGQLTGHTTESAALVESLQARVSAVEENLLLRSQNPTVYYELDAAPYYTAGPGSFVDMLIQRAGGTNIGATLQGEWAIISLEELLVQDPAFIILGDSAFGETPDSVASRPGWNSLTAVQTGKVYPFDYHLVSLPGPRWVDGLEALARLLHPDLFE
jgi:iron complex transport system substrate-binding protein